MITVGIDLVEDEWTEIAQGTLSIMLDIRASKAIAVHFSESDDAPDLDAPYAIIEYHQSEFDFGMSGLSGIQKIWVRSLDGVTPIVVIR